MDPRYSIVGARPRDLPALTAIERAAATLLEGHAPESVLTETTDEDELLEAQSGGRLWVALLDDAPVGFALVVMLGNGMPHLEEIDVDPEHGRCGIGRALVEAVCEWASRSGHSALTLTTFRSLPWNMPFYRSLGFEEVPPEGWSPEVAAVVRDEADRGLNTGRRAVMRYRPAEMARYFADYAAAFDAYDPDRIAAFFHCPCVMVGAASVAVLESGEDVSVQLRTVNAAVVTVRWNVTRSDGSPLWRFRNTYNLVRQGSGWKILVSITHDDAG